MKIKIIVFPLSVALTIILAIFFMKPTWDDIKKVEEEKKMYENKLATLNSKKEKVRNLMNQLSQNSEYQEFVNKYIPKNVKEEEIIDNLNYLAFDQSKLFVYSLSVPLLGKVSSPSSAGSLASGQVASQASSTFVNVNFTVMGSYDNIKNFLAKVADLERYNNIKELKIGPDKTAGDQNQKNANVNLRASGVFVFNYYNNDSLNINLEDKLFSDAGNFNMKVGEDIKNKIKTKLLPLVLDSAGRENPFSL